MFITEIKAHESLQPKCFHHFYFSREIKIHQSKFYLKSVHFITIQDKHSRVFQTDMHNKIT
jgi:hypothetical protein